MGPSGTGKPLEENDSVEGSLGHSVQKRREQGGRVVRKITRDTFPGKWSEGMRGARAEAAGRRPCPATLHRQLHPSDLVAVH